MSSSTPESMVIHTGFSPLHHNYACCPYSPPPTVRFMPRSVRVSFASAVALLLLSAAHIRASQERASQDVHKADNAAPASQTVALTDPTDLLVAPGVKAVAVEYRGRKAVRLTKDAVDEPALAFVNRTQFRDGTIEVDVATKLVRRPGVRMPGFTGIAFRGRDDGTHYELLYLRPGNASENDQAMRNHSVQYSSAPDFGWEKLRRAWPSIYESYADLQADEWTKLKISVHGRQAKLYVNGSEKPSLIVDGLKGEDLGGAIALWGYAGQETYFSNLRISNEKPEPLENGGEAAGTWEVTCATDGGSFGGTLKLVRQNSNLVGIWSGELGPDQQVRGTWRDGYVELTFGGTWPDQPGTVIATFDGWADGDSAKGRVKVEGRANGRWTAFRRK
jgi:hypothetical protein